jgi:XXXCH domain-containing protein
VGSSKKAKTKIDLPPSEAASFLRQLADALDEGVVRFNERDLEISGLVKVNESLKSKNGADQLQVKLKFLSAAPMDETADEPLDQEEATEEKSASKDKPKGKRPSYKTLKKSMSKLFKEIRQAAQDGQVPPAETVAQFCGMARQMITYPGKGDEYYPAFAEKVDQLESAAAAGDAAAVAEAHAALKEMRSSCHDKHK